MNPDNSAAATRPMLDWLVWTVIHGVVVAGISIAAFYLYNIGLACWIMASAIVAAAASLYLFARDVPGETFMKIILALCVAANAGFLIYNGAKAWGAASFNSAQVEKYKAAMGAAAQAKTRAVANAMA